MRVLKSILLTFLLSVFAGCAGNGSGMFRSSDFDGNGPIIENCHNLSDQYRVDAFITQFYLTTWFSALQEGAQEGIRNALDDKNSIDTSGNSFLRELIDSGTSRRETITRMLASPAGKWKAKVNTSLSVPKPVCKRYASRSSDVSRAVAGILSKIDYKLVVSDETWGVFETDFVERRKNNLRWRDRYVVFVDQEGNDGSIVRVFRDIFIDRSGGIFNQATSSGQNEAWILTQVQDKLKISTSSTDRTTAPMFD